MYNARCRFSNLIKRVKVAAGGATNDFTVFSRIHSNFDCALKGTGMSRAVYVVQDNYGRDYVMKVEHTQHLDENDKTKKTKVGT